MARIITRAGYFFLGNGPLHPMMFNEPVRIEGDAPKTYFVGDAPPRTVWWWLRHSVADLLEEA